MRILFVKGSVDECVRTLARAIEDGESISFAVVPFDWEDYDDARARGQQIVAAFPPGVAKCRAWVDHLLTGADFIDATDGY